MTRKVVEESRKKVERKSEGESKVVRETKQRITRVACIRELYSVNILMSWWETLFLQVLINKIETQNIMLLIYTHYSKFLC